MSRMHYTKGNFPLIKSSIQAFNLFNSLISITFFVKAQAKFSADLAKFLTLIQTDFSNSFESFVYILEICIVGKTILDWIDPVTSYTKKFPWNIHWLFSKLKIFFWHLKNNPSLSKAKLKCLVYCQVFWVKVQCLQDQYRSIWTLVFHYFISNIMQH